MWKGWGIGIVIAVMTGGCTHNDDRLRISETMRPTYDALRKTDAVRFLTPEGLTRVTVIVTPLRDVNATQPSRIRFKDLFKPAPRRKQTRPRRYLATLLSENVVSCRNFTWSIEDKAPTQIVSLSLEEAKRLQAPFFVEWGTYCLLTFQRPLLPTETLRITYEGQAKRIVVHHRAAYLDN